MHHNHLEGLLKYRLPGFTPKVTDSVGLGKFAFLKYSQVIFYVPVLGPCFENHWKRLLIRANAIFQGWKADAPDWLFCHLLVSFTWQIRNTVGSLTGQT